MTHLTPTQAEVRVLVRFFAAARDAAGTETAFLTLPAGSTVAAVVSELSGQSEEMALLLQKCTFLVDGVAVRDRATVLTADQTFDVLPPFAGG